MKKHHSAARKILKDTLSFQTSKRSLAVSAACIGLGLGLSAHANVYHEDNSTPQTSDQAQMNTKPTLTTLTNYQENAPYMFSSGLPDASHLSLLKEKGVTHVVDLIPGDRTSEILTTSKLGLDYFNVPVDWEGPTLANFLNYAAFTYLYRINVLGEGEQAAKKDLMAIWHPNPTWFAFMNEVIAHYNEVNGKQVAMSFEAAAPESH
ncbi:hypothetical protein RJ41_07345 [Alteromonas marina]|uniref:Uncharacterized protein n=1 Tax=Alteromonas marina TaxID=203795 RepID=A0A0B3YBA2_9ALTE|nr:hypothetical protein [Alteromonas marina]KHT54333.1 hypothetical protein RJ41_07345 [Alteromonas marina]